MKRIVPFVDHEIGYRLLKNLVTHSDARRFNIPVVVTTRENGKSWWPGVQEICIKSNIPMLVYESIFPINRSILQADWFLLLSWKHIIPVDLINIPKRGVLNLHYSLLPSYRGVYPVNWAIVNGEYKTGFTYHFVNEEIDRGEVFMQVEVPVRLSDTARTLQSRIDDIVCCHFDEFIERLLACDRDGCLGDAPNKAASGEYYSREKFEKACLIDLERSYRGIEIFNLLRGLTFFEDSKNAYVVDGKSKKKIYISINLREEQ